MQETKGDLKSFMKENKSFNLHIFGQQEQGETQVLFTHFFQMWKKFMLNMFWLIKISLNIYKPCNQNTMCFWNAWIVAAVASVTKWFLGHKILYKCMTYKLEDGDEKV